MIEIVAIVIIILYLVEIALTMFWLFMPEWKGVRFVVFLIIICLFIVILTYNYYKNSVSMI